MKNKVQVDNNATLRDNFIKQNKHYIKKWTTGGWSMMIDSYRNFTYKICYDDECYDECYDKYIILSLIDWEINESNEYFMGNYHKIEEALYELKNILKDDRI